MLLFCPHCSSILRITNSRSHNDDDEIQAGGNRFSCPTCPYICPISSRKPFYEKFYTAAGIAKGANEPSGKGTKQVDDIMGGKAQWENAARTEVQCPKEGCDGSEAMYYQLQIRSADEPMTVFYRCTACGGEWRE